MKKNFTEIVFILDESGSMSNLTDDTIGGFNSLLKKQKAEPGEAVVSTIMFSNDSRVVHDRVDIEKVADLTGKDYVPHACTALLDAVGGAVKHISNIHKYAREEDVPEKTLFIITTDGMENASRRFSYKEVKKLIKEKQDKYGWEFIFLGANIDAAQTAGSLGICEENAVNYRADKKGTAVLFEAVGSAMCEMRASKPLGRKWRAKADEDFASRSGE